LAQYSQVSGVNIFPAFTYFDFSGNPTGPLVLQITQTSNTDEPYQITPSGIVTLTTDQIFVAINYTIYESTPGANVNGNRRLAMCRISILSGTLNLDFCRYYQVETDWGRIAAVSSSLTVF